MTIAPPPISEAIIGDLNGDADVDGGELHLFSLEFGSACSGETPCKFDFNKDNKVDTLDLIVFAEDFGRGAGQ